MWPNSEGAEGLAFISHSEEILLPRHADESGGHRLLVPISVDTQS